MPFICFIHMFKKLGINPLSLQNDHPRDIFGYPLQMQHPPESLRMEPNHKNLDKTLRHEMEVVIFSEGKDRRSTLLGYHSFREMGAMSPWNSWHCPSPNLRLRAFLALPFQLPSFHHLLLPVHQTQGFQHQFSGLIVLISHGRGRGNSSNACTFELGAPNCAIWCKVDLWF